MEFKEFKAKFQEHFARMIAGGQRLFDVGVDKDELWNLYLDSFPAGTNEIFRKRREYDCSCCRQFMRNIGSAVTIENNQIHTLWEFDTGSPEFQPVVDALNAYVKAHPVTGLFITKTAKIGTDKNYEAGDSGAVTTWDHFYLELPHVLVDRSGRSIGDLQNEFCTNKQVFKRSLDEITADAVDTVLELIAQNAIYRGSEWKAALTDFRNLQRQYAEVPDELKDNFAWEQSLKSGPAVTRIRNHSMGTLLVDISSGMDLNEAVRKYEAIVAPENYKRPKAIYTKRMLDDAKNTVTDLGYLPSLERRFATLDDITVNNILFSNKDAAKRIGGSVFDEMEQSVAVDPKKFTRVQEVSAEDFVKNILPTATTIEALFENRHTNNLMSLIAPVNKDAPSMFKWDNGFSWAYAGNMTDSSMRENVKAAGGKVDGVLRFSIQWNDGNEYDGNDEDARCETPAQHIYFGHKRCVATGGELDVDIINPSRGKPAVENITWASKSRMLPGNYVFYVHCYNNRGGKSGFRAEIEFDGNIHSYDYNKPLRQGEVVKVATVHYDGHGGFTIQEMLPSTTASRQVWGLNTNQFVPVSVISYSPNYWDEQTGNGNRHYFFFLKGCVNPYRPNGFYNEFLKPEIEKHRRVFEALGSQMAVKDSTDQLSGLGFSSTKRNDLLVRVTGSTQRIIRIRF